MFQKWLQGLDGLVCSRSPTDFSFRTPNHVCARGQSSQYWTAAAHSCSCPGLPAMTRVFWGHFTFKHLRNNWLYITLPSPLVTPKSYCPSLWDSCHFHNWIWILQGLANTQEPLSKAGRNSLLYLWAGMAQGVTLGISALLTADIQHSFNSLEVSSWFRCQSSMLSA